ncbi:MAG: hypothetical protein GXO45_02380, partial [Aquificae bacterium]|nr:hypothetical protein [Aquificota bacterium]
MNKPLCQFYEKVKDKHKLDPDEFKTLLNIVRKEFSFLIEKNIPPIPENYEKWFYVFCHIIENKKDANDYEIIGLYKEFFDDEDIVLEDEKDKREISQKFKDVASKIDNAIKE